MISINYKKYRLRMGWIMKNIVIFGYGYKGTILAKQIYRNCDYKFYGFADNSVYKQGNFAYDEPIRSMEMLKKLDNEVGVSVIIASDEYYKEIIRQCEDNNIEIEGVFLNGRVKKYPFASFESLDLTQNIKLYAGDIMDEIHLKDNNLYGLSITHQDDRHILHDITKPYPLPDNSIAAYEAECVLELIDPTKIIFAIDEIYRILKPGGCFRITVPDHYSPYLKRRAMRDAGGNILYDAGETYAVKYGKDGLTGGWTRFTTYDSFKEILEQTKFKNYDWLCFHTSDGELHKKFIDMTKGYNKRVKNETSEDEYNIVVDCYK